MLFQALTAQGGWWLGALFILIAGAGMMALSWLAPIPMEPGQAAPPGFNPLRFRELAYLQTVERSPWSMALGAAHRIPWLAGGGIFGMSLLSVVAVGYSWRGDLERSLNVSRGEVASEREARQREREQLMQRVGSAEAEATGLRNQLRDLRSAYESEQRLREGAGSNEREARTRLGECRLELAQERNERRSEASQSQTTINTFHGWVTTLETTLREHCPMAPPLQRPRDLPADPNPPPPSPRPGPPRPPVR